ncbi:MAG: 4-hydroxythreonine-4-phosphate dehydrogenase PdxA [Jaaginema sp. PMC 1079.18]|nr:4-hydroxythreonine-4-phosphate dehydrogenase PdxA [Jaaginema sp. PMC 1080.18]MEC4850302.1 4-hydroxythreonine-4-phosphate dehydrogenase PdxA [Jaaginema sp. PMC 1079.18]MEC4865872.1 4-hydroxythreonine-4-phosphate dehydrogenase PdxA [Jaaginema sp. PMC 1078.18]
MIKPHLAIPIGDPAGIGPEVVLKALTDPQITEKCQISLVGDRVLLRRIYAHLKDQWLEDKDLANPDDLDVFEVSLTPEVRDGVTLGEGNAASGAASFAFLQNAIAHILDSRCHGLVTAPIAKSWWHAAGHNFPGQTEVCAQAAKIDQYGMMFVATSPHTQWTLRTLLATTHIPLSEVPTRLNAELLSRKLDVLVDSLKVDFGIAAPKIAIAGLNPHSGENGQLGREEKDWMQVWLEQERQLRPYCQLQGLVPPDTLWVNPGKAWYEDSQVNTADAYLALYHDQGLIPVKLMAFDQAINTTIGLPFIRTSPDHGTAFDIAGQGIANPASMKAAIQLAADLTLKRQTRA